MNNEHHSDLPMEVREKLVSLARSINAPQLAVKVWEELLSEEERKRLGDDLEEAWRRKKAMKGMTKPDAARLPKGTPSIWMRARGVSWEVAVIELAFEFEFLTPQGKTRLLKNIGVSEEASERMIDAAMVSGALVLRSDSREAFWRNQPIEVDWWEQDNAQWLFLWELCKSSKRGKWLTHIGERTTKSALSTQRNRLVSHKQFPTALCSKIRSQRNSGYKIELERNEIRLFTEEDGVLLEIT